ncbi:mechanosensitive ion channel family protein [Oceanobacillus piezotolerans]|uniref:Mechanosensitive ion channel family protein n=1 Tax=Oceanobacillus piezotolerans TaxID=2448030 RepID=A0A498D743_9BACI|nr:mechanosensitive ion channel family protein [Oceanobacillus piezotolerans]RLL41323.1 mechanosensitive ion channel family protein [Oceanobacillus piezotolerans]
MEEFNDQVLSFWDYLTGPVLWTNIITGFVKIVVIVLLAVLIVKVVRKLIDRFFTNRQKGPLRISKRRENTLTKLIKSIIAYFVYFVAIVMILSVFNINVGPLLAGAGVLGLAIGFGAQNLVRDVISGFFIIFEDQFSVGDYVGVAGIEGTVEEIGLRVTKVLSWTGEMHILPNGNVTQVINYSIHNGMAIVDINIPYESSVYEAERIINEVAETLPEKYDYLVGVPEIIGVQNLDVSHFVIRVITETLPASQWAAERNIRKEMQDHLYKAGIEIPSPRVVMYSGEEKAQMYQKRGYEQ